jgi:hypothetical protein
MKSTGPVDATATRGSGTTPVTAVTPMERPYPSTSQVPSLYVGSTTLTTPSGRSVTRSLPSVDVKLGNILAAQPTSLHAMRQR